MPVERPVSRVLKLAMLGPLTLASGYVSRGSSGTRPQGRPLRRVRSGMAVLICTGAFGLLGLVRYADQVRWTSAGAWLVVPALCSLLGLGLSGPAVSALLDPPEAGSSALPQSA